jgi:hypothetical protein
LATIRAVPSATPPSCTALGDLVHVVLHVVVDLVEQQVQADEVRPLDVPVGLLDLRLQVLAVGEPGVEQLDRLDAGRLGQVILCPEHDDVSLC